MYSVHPGIRTVYHHSRTTAPHVEDEDESSERISQSNFHPEIAIGIRMNLN